MKMPDKRIKAFLGGFHMVGAGGMDTCNFEKEKCRRLRDSSLVQGKLFFIPATAQVRLPING